MIKKITALLLTAAIATSLAACSGAGSTGSTASTPTAEGSKAGTATTEKITVRLVVPGISDEDTTDPISGVTSLGKGKLEAYIEERVPDIDVDLVSIPWDGWIQKIEAMITSNEVDVGFYTNQVMVPDWFIDHKPLLEKDPDVNLQTIKDLFIEPAVHYMNYKSFNYPEATGQIFGLPMTMASNVFVYDKQLFEDWGVEVPKINTTYEELISKAEKTTGTNPKTGKQNYGAFIGSMWMEWNAIGYDAVKVMQSDDMLLSSLDKAKYVDYIKDSPEVLKFFQDMARIVNVSPAGIATNAGAEKFFTPDNDIAINFHTNGISGAMYKYIYADKKDITDRFIPVFIPNGKEGKQGFPEFFRFAVTKNANDQEAAWKLVKNLTTNKEIVNFYLTNYAPDKLTALKDFSGMSMMDYEINKERHANQMKTMFITDDYWTWRVPLQGVNAKIITKEVTPEQARIDFHTGVNDWVENTKKQLGQ